MPTDPPMATCIRRQPPRVTVKHVVHLLQSFAADGLSITLKNVTAPQRKHLLRAKNLEILGTSGRTIECKYTNPCPTITDRASLVAHLKQLDGDGLQVSDICALYPHVLSDLASLEYENVLVRISNEYGHVVAYRSHVASGWDAAAGWDGMVGLQALYDNARRD